MDLLRESLPCLFGLKPSKNVHYYRNFYRDEHFGLTEVGKPTVLVQRSRLIVALTESDALQMLTTVNELKNKKKPKPASPLQSPPVSPFPPP
jgi:hypothetical protein